MVKSKIDSLPIGQFKRTYKFCDLLRLKFGSKRVVVAKEFQPSKILVMNDMIGTDILIANVSKYIGARRYSYDIFTHYTSDEGNDTRFHLSVQNRHGNLLHYQSIAPFQFDDDLLNNNIYYSYSEKMQMLEPFDCITEDLDIEEITEKASRIKLPTDMSL